MKLMKFNRPSSQLSYPLHGSSVAAAEIRAPLRLITASIWW